MEELRAEIAELRARVEKLTDLRARIEKLEGFRTSRQRLQIVRSSEDRRGRSQIARLLAGGSMKARGNGVAYTHNDLCRLLEPGVAVLAYGLGLVAVAMSEPDRWSTRAAYVIGEASEQMAHRKGV